MPFEIVRNDITKMQVDAIVNAANRSLLGGGGVDGCIHRAAGPELLAECRTLDGCETGNAKMTKGYRLPCRYVIHTVGPVWYGGGHGEREALISCYRTSLALARQYNCQSIAFPLISSGIYGYPKDQALRVALEVIGEFLLENDMTVYLVLFDRAACQIGTKLFSDIAEYIDDHYADMHTEFRRRMEEKLLFSEFNSIKSSSVPDLSRPSSSLSVPSVPSDPSVPPLPRSPSPPPTFTPSVPRVSSAPCIPSTSPRNDLNDLLVELDAGFSETLLELIDRSGRKDSEVYKKANVDRKLFSKIRSNPNYKPSKSTALAFAIALELDLDETKDLLSRAGFALSRSSKSDVIIEYFIQKRKYDIFEINAALFAFDQSLLGA